MDSLSVLLTARADERGVVEPGNHMLENLEHLTARGIHAFSAHWENISGSGEISFAYDAKSGKIIRDSNVNMFDIVHIYQLGKIFGKQDRLKELVSSLGENYKGIMINPPDTILDNMTKDYIFRLQDKGFPVPESIRISSPEDLKDLESLPESWEYIIKPINGEKGIMVSKLSEADMDEVTEFLNGKNSEGDRNILIVQEFIEDIIKGERSLIYLGDRFSHAVRKIPEGETYLANFSQGSSVVTYAPTREEIDLGFDIIQSWPSEIRYMRLDVAGSKDEPMIMEVELINPQLFVPHIKDYENYSRRLAELYCGLKRKH